MNKHLLIYIVGCLLPALTGYGQNPSSARAADLVASAKINNQPFADVSLFTKELASLSQKKVQTAVSEATFLALDPVTCKQLFRSALPAITLYLPYRNGTIELELVQYNFLSEDFSVVTNLSGGTPVDYTPGVYYRGICKGDDQSLVTLSVFEEEVIGFISYKKVGNLVLGRLEQQTGLNQYILYSDKDLLEIPEFICETDDYEGDKVRPGNGQHPTRSNGLPHCVRQFLEADYALYQDKGSVTATVNWLTGMFSQVAALFNGESPLSGLSMQLSQVYVWVSQDNYPATSSQGGSAAALESFKNTRTIFNGDLAMLIALGGNGLGGRAFRPGICGSSPYGYSNVHAIYEGVPTYSWTVYVVAHELGHNHGAQHTHACVWGPDGDEPLDCCGDNAGYPESSCTDCNLSDPPGGGTIMSYCHLRSVGIDFNQGFHDDVADTIAMFHDNDFKDCLATSCPGYSCSEPSDVSASNIGAEEATISWAAVSSASSYNLQYKLNAATAWTTVSSINTTSYAITGLTTGESYIAQVQAVCSGGSSAYSTGVIFKTGLTCPPASGNTLSSKNPVCSGAVFTLSISTSYASGYDFQWQSSPTNSSYTNFIGATSSTLVTAQTSTKWYRCIVSCASGQVISEPLQVAMESHPPNCVCIPSTTICSGFTPDPNMRINSVQMGNLENVNSTCSSKGYGDYSSGQNIPSLIVGSGDYASINFGGYQQRQCIYIDFNQDGDMDDPGEEIQIPFTGGSTQTGVINIPFNALTGNTRMRVRSRYASQGFPPNACDGGYYGETEDYTISITACPSTCYALPQVTTCSGLSPNPYMRIERVEVQTLLNNNQSCTNYSGYADYTNGQTVPSLAQGSSPSITVDVGDYAQRVSVFIDFNNDGNFGNVASGEEFQLPYMGSQTNTGTLTIPTGLTTGNRRMRIRSRYWGDGVYPPNAYDGQYYGETEDYTVFISSPLPVELTDFTADLTEEQEVVLKWTTASEVNTNYFSIERSHDGQRFEPLMEKAAIGNSDVVHNYEITDLNPKSGTNYYRLQIVDYDEQSEYSPIRSVFLQKSGFSLIGLFPNPAKNAVQLRFQTDRDQLMQFEITDVMGRKMQVFDRQASRGENLESVDLSSLSTGVYFVNISNGEIRFTSRMVKY